MSSVNFHKIILNTDKSMKKRKIRLLIAILSLFLMGNILHGQSKSKEALGNSLAESIAGNDMDRFKSLLLPKDVAIKYQKIMIRKLMIRKSEIL